MHAGVHKEIRSQPRRLPEPRPDRPSHVGPPAGRLQHTFPADGTLKAGNREPIWSRDKFLIVNRCAAALARVTDIKRCPRANTEHTRAVQEPSVLIAFKLVPQKPGPQ